MPAGHVAGLEGKGLNYNQHRKNLKERGREFFQRIATVLMHRFLGTMEKLYPLYSPNPSNTSPFCCKCCYQRAEPYCAALIMELIGPMTCKHLLGHGSVTRGDPWLSQRGRGIPSIASIAWPLQWGAFA